MTAGPRALPVAALVYEPVAYSRSLINQLLGDLGYRPVDFAMQPVEIERALHQQRHDLVILNWSSAADDRGSIAGLLGGMHAGGLMSARFVLVTHDARDPNCRLALDLGFAMIVLKPFSLKVLGDRIRWVVEHGHPAGTAARLRRRGRIPPPRSRLTPI